MWSFPFLLFFVREVGDAVSRPLRSRVFACSRGGLVVLVVVVVVGSLLGCAQQKNLAINCLLRVVIVFLVRSNSLLAFRK